MAMLEQRPSIKLEVSIRLTEEECKALEAIVGWSIDEIVKALGDVAGQSYVRDHSAGIYSFFQSCRGMLPGFIARLKAARGVFDGKPTQ